MCIGYTQLLLSLSLSITWGVGDCLCETRLLMGPLSIPQMIYEWIWSSEKPVIVPLCPRQIPHGLTWVQTWDSTDRSWQLTTWAMAQPSLADTLIFCYKSHRFGKYSKSFLSLCSNRTQVWGILRKNQLLHLYFNIKLPWGFVFIMKSTIREIYLKNPWEYCTSRDSHSSAENTFRIYVVGYNRDIYKSEKATQYNITESDNTIQQVNVVSNYYNWQYERGLND
jgi:hypothetical protein